MLNRYSCLIFLVFVLFYHKSSYSAVGVGVKFGVYKLTLNVSGTLKSGKTVYDVDRTFDMGNSTKDHFFVDLALPFLPNVRFESLPFNHKGDATVKVPIDVGFFNIKINAYDRVKTRATFNRNYDLLLYYDFRLPFMTPKIGIGAKYARGEVYAKAEKLNKEDESTVSSILPLIYLGAESGVPIIPMYLSAHLDGEIRGISYDNSYYLDVFGSLKFKIHFFQSTSGLFFGIGYRYWHLVLKNLPSGKSNPEVDLVWKGTVAILGLDF